MNKFIVIFIIAVLGVFWVAYNKQKALEVKFYQNNQVEQQNCKATAQQNYIDNSYWYREGFATDNENKQLLNELQITLKSCAELYPVSY